MDQERGRQSRALIFSDAPPRNANALDEDGGDNEAHEEEQGDMEEDAAHNALLSLAPSVHKKIRNPLHIPMPAVKELFGESVELPIDVIVDVPEFGMRQLVRLRSQGSLYGVFHINEPLLSKIKCYSGYHRKWSQSESSGSDGIPCLMLELGTKKNGATSQYMGVHLRHKLWLARTKAFGKTINIGFYSTEEEAARIYDSTAYYLRGAQAKVNFPDEQPQPLSDEIKARIEARIHGTGEGGHKRARAVEGEEEVEEEACRFGNFVTEPSSLEHILPGYGLSHPDHPLGTLWSSILPAGPLGPWSRHPFAGPLSLVKEF